MKVFIITIYFLFTTNPFKLTTLNLPLKKLENFQNLSVEKDVSIFFLETSFVFYEYRKLWISERAACAVESAALHHPRRPVHLVFASPGFVEESLLVLNGYLTVLESYPNIKISQINMDEYLEGTPAKKFYFRGKLDLSPYRIEHYSDLLRVMLLWKNGGIYFDHDVIVLKSLDDLGRNFIGAENNWSIAPGIMGFGHDGRGHDLLTKFLKNLSEHYSGRSFTEIGPDFFTDLIVDLCGVSRIQSVINKQCSTVRILDSKHFYAIPGRNWEKLFDEKYNEEVMEMTKYSHVSHFWYGFSRSVKIEPNMNTPFIKFAERNCLRTYRLRSEYL